MDKLFTEPQDVLQKYNLEQNHNNINIKVGKYQIWNLEPRKLEFSFKFGKNRENFLKLIRFKVFRFNQISRLSSLDKYWNFTIFQQCFVN